MKVLDKPLLIERYKSKTLDVEWGVSFTSSNPLPNEYIACITTQDAQRLIEIITQYYCVKEE